MTAVLTQSNRLEIALGLWDIYLYVCALFIRQCLLVSQRSVVERVQKGELPQYQASSDGFIVIGRSCSLLFSQIFGYFFQSCSDGAQYFINTYLSYPVWLKLPHLFTVCVCVCACVCVCVWSLIVVFVLRAGVSFMVMRPQTSDWDSSALLCSALDIMCIG